MGDLILSDEQIQQLLSAPKKITTPNARWRVQRGSKQRNFLVTSEDQKHEFSLFFRQNQRLTQGFSCGLLYHHPCGKKIMLTRYNGNDHPHHNALDGSRCDFSCHIHMATSQYMVSGRKAEHFAQSTQRYTDLRGAAAAITDDCNISGLKLSCFDEEGDNETTHHQQLDLGLE